MWNFRAHTQAFTIVELLVVISIVALLIALLMPALAKARETGKRLTCLSNERAVGQAAHMYAADNRGYGPPTTDTTAYKWYKATTTSYSNPTYDPIVYPPVQGLNFYFGYDEGTPATSKFYYRTKGCPNYAGKSVADSMCYAGNCYILGMANTRHPTLRDFWVSLDDHRLIPSEVGLFVESYDGGLVNLGLTNIGRPNSPYEWAPRHQGEGLNLIYVDGHGSFDKIETLGITTRFRGPGSR